MSALVNEIESLRLEMKALSDFIFDNPELGNCEYKAHEKLTAMLEKEGFSVEKEVSGLPTAFRAIYKINGGWSKDWFIMRI